MFWFLAIFLLLAIGAAVVYWWVYRKQFVREQLEAAVIDGSDGLYRVRYTQMRMDEIKGWIQIQNLEVDYDSIRFQQLADEGKAPPMLMRIKIPELKINGVKTPRALLGTELLAGEIMIERPEVELIYTRANDTVKSRRMPGPSDYDQLLGRLDKISLSKLTIHEGKLKTGYLRSKGIPLELNGVKLELADIVVDSINSVDPDRLLFARDIFLDCDEIKWLSGDGRYRFSMDSVNYQSKNRALDMGRFKIEPQLSEADFTRSLRFADDRFDLALRGIKIFGLQLASMQHDSLLADSVFLGRGHFHVYRDLGLPHDGKNRLGTYPHQLLRKAGIAIDLGKIEAAAIDIKYKERSAVTRQAGVVHFANTSFRISGVNNIKDEGDNVMVARIYSSFLQKAALNITWKFYTHASNGRFEIVGKMGRTPRSCRKCFGGAHGPRQVGRRHSEQSKFFNPWARLWSVCFSDCIV
ncbi:MAG: hypothetical protein NVV59_01405 [Chitinophagaceae bacterium]|nr:hypothetical protein [Chitinophagaceae bacterium]